MAGRFSISTVFKAVDRLTAPVRKMQKGLGRFTRAAERGFNKAAESLHAFTSAAVAGAAKTATAVAGTATALALLSTNVAAADTETQLLAASVQTSADTLEALGAAVAPAGFQLDNVVDLIEEMNNKLGESAGLEEITPVNEALTILGLNFEKLRDMKPEEQFARITDAALGMADAQKAAAAADILLGGEANKIIGVLRQQGGTVDEITSKYKALSFRTAESRAGAMALTKATADATFALKSLIAEVVGLAGGEAAGFIDKLTESMKNLDRAAVQAKVREVLTGIGNAIKFLIDNGAEIWKWTQIVAGALAAMAALSVALKTVALAMGVVNIVMAANPLGLIVIAIAAVVAGLVWLATHTEEVGEWFKWLGAKIVEFWGYAKEVLPNPFAPWLAVLEQIKSALARVAPLAQKVSDTFGRAVDFLGFGDEEGDERRTSEPEGGALAAAMVSPSERVARSIEERRSVDRSEITIRDDTGRAEVTGAPLGNGLQLMRSGVF
jgi:hypothetical protein